MYIFFYCFCRLSLSWLYNGGVGVRIVGSLLCGGYIMWVVNVDDSFSLNIKGWILNDIYLLLRYYIFRMGRWFVYMIQPCPGPDVGVILWDRFLLLHIKCFHITCSLFHQIDFFMIMCILYREKFHIFLHGLNPIRHVSAKKNVESSSVFRKCFFMTEFMS